MWLGQWHDDRKHPGSWKKGAPRDHHLKGPSSDSADVWDCYNNKGKSSSRKKPSEDRKSDGRSSSPEKEFTSFSRNLPARVKMGVDLLVNGQPYMDLPHVSAGGLEVLQLLSLVSYCSCKRGF